MSIVAVIGAIAVALLATGISNKQAKEYVTGKTERLNVTPGSGQFFDEIAGQYDFLNQVLSLGLHSSWRQAAIQKAVPATSVLDISTGTADLAIAIATSHSIRVVGLDPSREMLSVGRNKLTKTGTLVGSVDLVEGVAEELPFEDESFDSVIVAFGVRNFQNREKGLAEIYRVVKSGGKCVVLELSLPRGNGFLHQTVRLFVTKIMPKLAAFIGGNEDAYQYLSDSMAVFPGPDEFKEMLATAGLTIESHERLAPLGMGPDLYLAYKKEEKMCTGDQVCRDTPPKG